ncbi:MAG: hypothetical protein K0S28_681 [Paucimonas sp.]|jgi:hypothetical protein|nr:hypothetical protein [Paucimonas sp.]
MLKEIKNIAQSAGSPARRWFAAKDADLIVWLDENGRPTGFQFCYEKAGREKALTWKNGRASHCRVDDGEATGGMRYKATPIMGDDEPLPPTTIDRLAAMLCAALPSDVRSYVTDALDRVRKLPPSQKSPDVAYRPVPN